MKILARVLAYGSAALIALTPLEIKNIPMMPIWPIRLFVSGCAPLVAAAGGVGALIAALCKDQFTALVGLLSALFSVRHIKGRRGNEAGGPPREARPRFHTAPGTMYYLGGMPFTSASASTGATGLETAISPSFSLMTTLSTNQMSSEPCSKPITAQA